jgi:hypothetical protein
VNILLLAIASLLFSAELLLGPAGADPYVIETVRLPRAVGAVVGGVLLGLSGLLLQTALRNPLADPYVLGVSGVAVLTALGSYLLWRLLGMPYLGFYLGALIGASAATAALLLLASRAGILVVLMTGVLLSYASSSILQLMLLALPPEELGYLYVGLQGSFAAYPAGVPGVVAALVALAVVVVVFLNLRHVATLMHGERRRRGWAPSSPSPRIWRLGCFCHGSCLSTCCCRLWGPRRLGGCCGGMYVRFDVVKRLGDFTLEVSGELREGLTCVVGPNGSGKTTLLKILAGLLKPDKGAVEYVGVEARTYVGELYVPPDAVALEVALAGRSRFSSLPIG